MACQAVGGGGGASSLPGAMPPDRPLSTPAHLPTHGHFPQLCLPRDTGFLRALSGGTLSTEGVLAAPGPTGRRGEPGDSTPQQKDSGTRRNQGWQEHWVRGEVFSEKTPQMAS